MTPEEVLGLIAEEYYCSLEKIMSKKRSDDVSEMRFIAFRLMKKYLRMTSTDTARFFGKKCHSTVLHGMRVLAEKMEIESVLRKRVEKLEAQVESRIYVPPPPLPKWRDQLFNPSRVFMKPKTIKRMIKRKRNKL